MLKTCVWLLAGAGFTVTLVASLTAPLACTNRTLPARQHCPTGCNVRLRQLVRDAACLSLWTFGSHRQPCSLKPQLDSEVWLCTGMDCTSSVGHPQYAVSREELLPQTCSGVGTADASSSPHSVGSMLVGADLVALWPGMCPAAQKLFKPDCRCCSPSPEPDAHLVHAAWYLHDDLLPMAGRSWCNQGGSSPLAPTSCNQCKPTCKTLVATHGHHRQRPTNAAYCRT